LVVYSLVHIACSHGETKHHKVGGTGGLRIGLSASHAIPELFFISTIQVGYSGRQVDEHGAFAAMLYASTNTTRRSRDERRMIISKDDCSYLFLKRFVKLYTKKHRMG